MLWRNDLLNGGEVIILQPRRIAARMLARRVAEETGTRLGEEVGYQVRFEGAVSARTRIRFCHRGDPAAPHDGRSPPVGCHGRDF